MSNWISVEDKLPEEGVKVLCSYENYNKHAGFIVAMFVNGSFYGGGNYAPRGITHWMPLPEPPKK